MVRNLSTLSILHYVFGIFVCLAGAVMLVFIFVGMLMQSDMVQQEHDAPPMFVGNIMQGLGWFLFALMELLGILILLSGRWIAKRRNRNASLILAGFCCLNFPLGTALGIYTFVVLLNDEVQREYQGAIPPVA